MESQTTPKSTTKSTTKPKTESKFLYNIVNFLFKRPVINIWLSIFLPPIIIALLYLVFTSNIREASLLFIIFAAFLVIIGIIFDTVKLFFALVSSNVKSGLTSLIVIILSIVILFGYFIIYLSVYGREFSLESVPVIDEYTSTFE